MAIFRQIMVRTRDPDDFGDLVDLERRTLK